ncbi:hypothetical protein BN2476_80110 [Paraburkholderia piptadeniae]|uniref:Transposase n=1 Tax=Paraburkholderia piptadeniae TaxID=1701573 RepID=A0A1N7RM65_9BURK|nr:hypothetical protein BN2476_80110 [Paraburkholderia piptadeniae]
MPIIKPGPTTTTRVLRVRLKDRHASELLDKAFWVNRVWNYSNELSHKVWERERRFIGNYEIDRYTSGASKAGVRLHSQTIQAVSAEYVTRRGSGPQGEAAPAGIVRFAPQSWVGAVQGVSATLSQRAVVHVRLRPASVALGQLRSVRLRARGRLLQRGCARTLVPERDGEGEEGGAATATQCDRHRSGPEGFRKDQSR